MVLRDAENIFLINLTHTLVNYARSFVVIVTCYNKNIFVTCGPFYFPRFMIIVIVVEMGYVVSFSPQKFIMAQTNVKACFGTLWMQNYDCVHTQQTIGRETTPIK